MNSFDVIESKKGYNELPEHDEDLEDESADLEEGGGDGGSGALDEPGSQELQVAKEETTWEKARRRLKKIGKALWAQWFIFGMAFVILLAYLAPQPGRKGGWLHPEITAKYVSVIVIFLLTGMSIKVVALKNALLSWKIQILMLVVNFMVFSALVYGVVQLLAYYQVMDRYILEGLVIMGALPTTVSSCNVLAQTAGGNEAVAVVNSVISNTIGVFLSPALILMYMGVTAKLDIGLVFLQLGATVMIPMAVGTVLQFVAKKPVAWLKAKLNFSYINQFMILFVIYCTFCDTFSTDISLDGKNLVILVALVVGFNLAFLALSWLVFWPKFLRFSFQDRVSALFCTSQKTLTVGVPLIAIIYAGSTDPGTGLASLPILLFHPIQLVLAGLIAPQLKAMGEKYKQEHK